ncbi:MAG: KaiC 1 [Zetaproteobacteria bacterium CG12_big_fil_rev_8_21_14_0_65_55_1124]|nr:MAG: KaiC 1 [Zetaproteobacteria bacterium CG08_land_8_20_14_0_20_55_17]PIW43688.1 MAG: KaiC 1 [Zetaproteobacteria bacterium CG12_big_fil_rev_8_21_14_0_65_55_1124]PIY52782.1 MAG: KaiC 1 [Zetaproteobacteria bacterium CG_4_10_14_0_8_um_filter_55_43]PIZ37966.1 MAG: KaiC 1 [Zetaproteobacteria bacterium CG_4_10_14_0_2_um_filter_55_20]PJB80571.1 MAG: KaiC 1 [Zetaproteobacteria bacterium CG_4_9_14_0_8_um_filter_55_31]
MVKSKKTSQTGLRAGLKKSPTGIAGLDQITDGGLPQGRPTLVCGGTGCGKTLLAMEFLVHGATEFNEPGVFMSFEETVRDLTENVVSLGFDLQEMIARKQLVLDYVYVERSEIEESGEYDLEGLFIRLGAAIDAIGARRVVLDTIETLFAGLPDPAILRAELRRLFRWLKDKGVTAVITGERGDKTLTRQGLEEYVSDCVIVLDHRVSEQTSSRRLRVVKYRGSTHGTNEYPFLIDADGISVLPVTALGLKHKVSAERVSSGVPRLDAMLGGKGYYRGSSVLISGTAGTGKSSLAAHFANNACLRGDRVLYFSFEESPDQIIRNMRSIGLDLQPWIKAGLLQIHAHRPSSAGLETHLALKHQLIMRFKPQVVIMDPLNSFVIGDNAIEVKSMLMRLVDFLKTQQITGLFTNLAQGGGPVEQTEVAISSLIDTWLLLRDIDSGGERNRCLSILKSRGMAHSNQIREFLLTDQGVELRDVYVGPEGVLTGSARLTKEAENQATLLIRDQEVELRQIELERKRTTLEAQIAMLRAEFAVQEVASQKVIGQETAEKAKLAQGRVDMGVSRKVDAKPNKGKGASK